MAEPKNLHDAFFKDLFSRPEVAHDFLAHHLPADVSSLLDLSHFELMRDSFVDPELQSTFSDLLYRVRLKGGGSSFVYILFEHKSAPEKFVAFQLLVYMIRIWEQALKEGAKKLPPIFPLVLYHGKAKWNVARNFSSLIDSGVNVSLKKYVPDFEYYLFDTAGYDEEQAEDEAALKIGLAALKYVFRSEVGEKLREYLKYLRLMPVDKAMALADVVVRYIFGAAAERVTIEDAKSGLQRGLSKARGEAKMETIIEQLERVGLEKGIQQGRQEGIQQGIQQGAIAVTLYLLQKKFGKISRKTESQVRKLSIEKLEELGGALLDMQKRKELTDWLRQHETSTTH